MTGIRIDDPNPPRTTYSVHFGPAGGDIDVVRFDVKRDADELFYELVSERPRDWRVWITETTVSIISRGRGVAENV